MARNRRRRKVWASSLRGEGEGEKGEKRGKKWRIAERKGRARREGTRRGGARWMILRRRFGGRWRSGGLKKKKGTVERGTEPDQTGPGPCRLPPLRHRTGLGVETGARRKEGGRLGPKSRARALEEVPRDGPRTDGGGFLSAPP